MYKIQRNPKTNGPFSLIWSSTAVTMKSYIFRDFTLIENYRRFGGMSVNIYQTTRHHIFQNYYKTVHTCAEFGSSHPGICRVVALLVVCVMLDSWSAWSSTLKIKAICSSETYLDFQRITWRYIPEDRILLPQILICIFSIRLNSTFIG